MTSPPQQTKFLLRVKIRARLFSFAAVLVIVWWFVGCSANPPITPDVTGSKTSPTPTPPVAVLPNSIEIQLTSKAEALLNAAIAAGKQNDNNNEVQLPQPLVVTFDPQTQKILEEIRNQLAAKSSRQPPPPWVLSLDEKTRGQLESLGKTTR